MTNVKLVKVSFNSKLHGREQYVSINEINYTLVLLRQGVPKPIHMESTWKVIHMESSWWGPHII